MKPLVVLFTALFLTALTSCSEVDDRLEENDSYINDTELTQLISTDKNLKTVSLSNLPPSLISVLDQDFKLYSMTGAQVSIKNGYKVILLASLPEADDILTTVYFSSKGRQLKNDGRDQDDLPEGEGETEEQKNCFNFIYPISFTMPDGTKVEGDNSDVVSQRLRSWYESNRGVDQKPLLNFPVNIQFKGERLRINNEEDLEKTRVACSNQLEGSDGQEEDGGQNEDGEDLPSDDQDEDGQVISGKEDLFLQFDCFELSFPATITMPDGSTIHGEDIESLSVDVKNWYSSNLTTKSQPSFQYPLNLKLGEDLLTVNSKEELRELEGTCDSDGGLGSEEVNDDQGENTNDFDCPDAKANVGDKCIDQDLKEGTLDRNCSCQIG